MLGNSGNGSSNGVDLKFLTYAGAGEEVNKIKQVQTSGRGGGPNFSHFVRT